MSGNKQYKDLSDLCTECKNQKELAKLIAEDSASVVRGHTPDDIEDQCLRLCQQYLAGNWSQLTRDQITVERLVGGWVNQMYHVEIDEPKQCENVPQEVAIKFDMESVINRVFDDKKLKDIIISLVFSNNNLGPKVYGVFDNGIIMKYYKNRYFDGDEHGNAKMVEQVFRKLAHVHALDVPIKKDPDWQFRWIDHNLNKARDMFDLKQEMEEFGCEVLKTLDFEEEIRWLTQKLAEVESPVVFTHNDFRSANLLIAEPNDELIVCDFDLSCYSHRGFDFLLLWEEFGPKLEQDQFETGYRVEDSVFGPLIALYIDECQRIHGKSFSDEHNNSVEHILNEIKFFWCLYTFRSVTISLCTDPNDKTGMPLSREVAMGFTEHRAKNYRFIKELLINKNIVSP